MRNLLVVLACCLGGCATASLPTTASNPGLNAQEQAEQAALATILKSVSPAAAATQKNYLISPSDLVDVTVYRETDLNRTIRVNAAGEISLPLVGALKVGGLSIIDAERVISDKLREFLVNPQITIFIKEYSSKQVFILGEVKSPGALPLPSEAPMTVLEAITKAGGFTGIAAPDRTRVIRNTADGKSQGISIPVSAITKEGQKDKDIPLAPNDVVYVPQSFF
ncbi:MAG: polysaccharide export protein [Elusimicrobia bacterium]|nr:polysaccharide export protein [Elusimicrobiota bacterium]